MFCCLPVVYVLGRVLVRDGNKNRQNFTGTYVQNRPHTEKPGKSSYLLPKKKNFERMPRELQCSDRAQTSTTGSGRPSCVDVVLGFWLKVLVRRDKFQNRRKFHKYTYTYKAPFRGVGHFPRGDASWHATGESYQSPSSGTRSMRVIPTKGNI